LCGCFKIQDFRFSVQNNGNYGNSILASLYNAKKADGLDISFNISRYNASTAPFHRSLGDQSPISDDNRGIWPSQPNTNISYVNQAFESPTEMNSGAWGTKVDRLNMNMQKKSVSDNKQEYLR